VNRVEELFLSHSINKLMQMSGYAGTCLRKLDPDQIRKRGGDAQNSVGNLVLHLCGNIRQWIGSSIGGLTDIRNREEEFAPASRCNTAELLALLNSTVAKAVAILKAMRLERLTDRVATQDGERAVLEVIYQVVGHFQQHTGQILFATKLFTGEDLKLYAPPKKSS
jgi:uncharacterized damage-inducible protein DinB